MDAKHTESLVYFDRYKDTEICLNSIPYHFHKCNTNKNEF